MNKTYCRVPDSRSQGERIGTLLQLLCNTREYFFRGAHSQLRGPFWSDLRNLVLSVDRVD